eukprot:1142353-Pelagomonas_calceolata.AAC.3
MEQPSPLVYKRMRATGVGSPKGWHPQNRLNMAFTTKQLGLQPSTLYHPCSQNGLLTCLKLSPWH